MLDKVVLNIIQHTALNLNLVQIEMLIAVFLRRKQKFDAIGGVDV
jgi:hypothetical protein